MDIALVVGLLVEGLVVGVRQVGLVWRFANTHTEFPGVLKMLKSIKTLAVLSALVRDMPLCSHETANCKHVSFGSFSPV